MSLTNINRSALLKNKPSGFTLLEVMVAMVIFSIGLLGLAGMQAQSVQFSHSAYLRSQATFYAYDILEKMRANRVVASTNSYDTILTDAGTDNSCYDDLGNCSATQLAAHDIFDWKQLLATLPSGNGTVTPTVTGVVTTFAIVVRWSDRSATNGTGIESITVRSEI